MTRDLTKGSIFNNLIIFAIPYLIACFLQTFYGMADLFIAGRLYDASVISAVSIGSQVMHMITVVIAGLAMGSTVKVSMAMGAREDKDIKKAIGNTAGIFIIFAFILTIISLLGMDFILSMLQTPEKSLLEAKKYLFVCCLGIPFIVAYNVVSSIFRGLGDTKTPMIFVFIAGIINIGLDFILMGIFNMGAMGAAFATVLAQTISVILSILSLKKIRLLSNMKKEDFRFDKGIVNSIIHVGVPVSLQDGIIQVAFLIITAIANSRGLVASASVGIVEKIISFLFLVPSAMLSSISAIAAQNRGAGFHDRGRKTLYYGMIVGMVYGLIVSLACIVFATPILRAFSSQDEAVVVEGVSYLKSYVFDVVFASFHFCFSGYFCAYSKSGISFLHNILSAVLVRIPGAYLASVYFTDSLFYMGLAAPLGSIFSTLICITAYAICLKKWKNDSKIF
ncbi:putative efflux protein, MATE family [Acetitomaculum ruminis DSM 5522]|uniref:Probable multidrug resistance protein NorM n=1 Tax=Acetitomaculum ruminis DSM 5522 TaxID=1120918 RepID=A0A1I1A3L7_9FIRM|nr:MATE family efflux transporter [Acetitomaculum ruminis]SFB32511.1 putative efflux protein, MATE family [Acetitomaculum ruminis DSM 5522]